MSQTIPDIHVDDTAWVDVNTASGVAVGSKFRITLKSTTWCRLYEGTVAPAIDSKDGEVITDKYNPYNVAVIPAGSSKIWARSSSEGRSSDIMVQEI
jgi:hypothetical protein